MLKFWAVFITYEVLGDLKKKNVYTFMYFIGFILFIYLCLKIFYLCNSLYC